MRKIMAVLLAITVCFLTASVHAQEKVVMYAMDGREITVPASDVEAYRKVGWYDDIAAVTTIMYATDGRQTRVFVGEKEEYKNVGWFENIGDVTRKMYAADGRQITVFLDEIQAYRDVGWYDNLSDVTRTMYAADGRQITVFIGDMPAYRNVGWYDNLSDVTKTMYSMDGRKIMVYLADVEAFRNVGWYDSFEDVSAVMYALDGREIRVLKRDVEAYKAVGWYDDVNAVSKLMYSMDGRQLRVLHSEVEAYKAVGWYETKPYAVDPSKPMLALTFDDGPKAATTKLVLDALEQNGARATFFVLGSNAKGNTEILERMVKLGCQIGNHSYGHPDLKTLSDANVAYQIDQTEEIVKKAVGFEPSVVRPPYGSYSSSIMSIAEKPFILWSVDTLDWKYRDAEYVKNYVLEHAYDGAIILMHDIHATTAEAMKSLIPELIARGYQLVTVDELAMHKGHILTAGKAYSQFR